MIPQTTRVVPDMVYRHLRTGFIIATAELILESVEIEGAAPGEFVHPGDAFGSVLAWLWRSGERDEVAMMLAELMSELRVHNRHARPPLVRFADVLDGLDLALPGFSDHDTAELVAYARRHAPGYMPSGTDLNA